jgi:hypothetical protein
LNDNGRKNNWLNANEERGAPVDGYVALLDVLGFSALVSTDRSGDMILRYLAQLEEATAQSQVGYVVFSDSIVLTTKSESPESFIAISRACSKLMADLLTEGIALRGAIVFGDFVRKAVGESLFVAGRAVIDAYQFEKAQDWVGIMVAPSALGHVRDLGSRCRMRNYQDVHAIATNKQQLAWPAFIQHCEAIPFHGMSPAAQETYDGYAVVPTNGIVEPTALVESISRSIERLKWLRTLAPSPRAQLKYKVPVDWLSRIQAIWREVVRFSGQQP